MNSIYKWTCWTLGLAVVVLTAALGYLQQSPPPGVTPEAERYGLVENHLELAEPIVRAAAPLQIVGAEDQDNTRKNVRLWDAVLKVDCPGKPAGQHFPNVPQQIGDCTSHATSNAINYLLAVQIASTGQQACHRAYPPFLYGSGRVLIGKGQIRGDGCVVAWVVEAAEEIGVLAVDDPSVPPYSGVIAREWGRTGPPRQFRDMAMARLVKSASPVKSATDAMNAICNGYPVVIGSSFGTNTIRPENGRQMARWDASWPHAMCIVAYDGSGPEPCFYWLNSWGDTAHPAPLNGEPPGGFWVTRRDTDRAIRGGDAWVLSNLDGFPARDLDFNVFGN